MQIFQIKDYDMWQKSSLKNTRGRKFAPPVHFNVTDFHCKDRKNSQNKILASTSILPFLRRAMIKLSGLGTGLG